VSGDLNATGATASAQWVLNNKGYWVFTGNVSNQDIFPDNYIFAMRLNVLDGNGDPIAVVQSNSVGPDLLWINNRASWDQRGFDQRVADLWPAIVSAQMRADFKASTRPFLGVIESIGIVVVAVLAIIGGGEFAAHCLNNPTVGPYRDNNGGVGVAAIFHCQ
jgi:hypothetical protein